MRLFTIFLVITMPTLLSAQVQEHCANHIILNLISINFAPGCDFTDYGGIDGAITIFDLQGNILINNEVEDLNQVNGPADNVSFNLSSNPDCCGNGYSQTLGIFPIDEILFDFIAEIYDNDGGCCDGYQANSDDNYGTDTISINIIDDATGTINVGSCISFNYELDITPIYEYGRMELVETVCSDFEISFNNIIYNIDNPMGFDTLWGASANGCDSFIHVQLDFYEHNVPAIVGEEFICYGGTGILSLSEEYESYSWSTGETSAEIEIDGPGIYIVMVETAETCILQDVIIVDYHTNFFPTIIGPQEFCEGNEATLEVSDNFNSYVWNNGSTELGIVVTESGEYSVTVVNDEGCISENSFQIIEVFIDEPIILGETIFCFDDFTEITIDGLYSSYTWNNGLIGPIIQVDESGIYTVTVSNALGCETEGSIVLIERDQYILIDTIYTCLLEEVGQESSAIISPDGCMGRMFEATILYAPIPDYELVPTQTIIAGDMVILYVNLEIPGSAQINWYGPDGALICSNCPSIELSPGSSISYEVEIDYHVACQIRETVEVIVKSNTSIYIPNVFTPDSQDGNNRFKIYGVDILSIETFSLYDRWGNLIFDESGIDAEWDGTMGGVELVSGVYVYYIALTFNDGSSKTLAGDITLLQ